MTTLNKSFDFQEKNIRVLGTPDAPLFVAADVCAVLTLSDVSMALANHPEDEKGTRKVGTLGGEQSVLVVTEAGLYRLIFRSNKPNAKSFQRWVFHEVLPSIRKSGAYLIGEEDILNYPIIKTFDRVFSHVRALGADPNAAADVAKTVIVREFPRRSGGSQKKPLHFKPRYTTEMVNDAMIESNGVLSVAVRIAREKHGMSQATFWRLWKTITTTV